MPIDPSFSVIGGEWQLGPLDGPAGPEPQGEGFGQALAQQIGRLGELQSEAAEQSQALAAGTAADPTEVVMAVERARLAMQLASQLRTKSLEAIQDVFHTQV